MPRRQLLTKMEKEALLAIPIDESELVRLTTFIFMKLLTFIIFNCRISIKS